MEQQYIYFLLGIILGLAIALYWYADRKEKLQKQFDMDKKLFSTKELDKALENAVVGMQNTMKQVKRELTEEEKNQIITDCLKSEMLVK